MSRPSLLLKVMQGQQYKGRMPVQVKIDGWMEIYQLTCPVRQDAVLNPDCLAARRTQLSALPPQYIRSPFRLEDYQARQDIAADTLLRMNLLKPRPLVKRGNVVRVIVQNGALRLLAQGEALESGARNETIRVKILSFQSQKVVQARISDEDEVTLDSGI
ncbi:MAG: flagellar basal body P-ring formation protein FlgA [Candidatus Sericytochromatia bacterium]|nr:flagellar basal body P-ring formation protein FlgA [Candidatus Sericytochromatia bacterium]